MQTAKLKEAAALPKGITDVPTAPAQPKSADLRRERSDLFDREKTLGAWPKPDMLAVKRRVAASMSVVHEWTRLLSLGRPGDDIRGVTDDWDGVLKAVKESMNSEAGK